MMRSPSSPITHLKLVTVVRLHTVWWLHKCAHARAHTRDTENTDFLRCLLKHTRVPTTSTETGTRARFIGYLAGTH
jgi:hypothetical protein